MSSVSGRRARWARLGQIAGDNLLPLLSTRYAENAVSVLCRTGASPSAAVPPLVELLQRGTPDLRRLAARALGRLGPKAAAAVSALTGALESDDVYLRLRVVEALGQIGIETPEVRTALTGIIRTTDDAFLRTACINALVGEVGI